MKELNKEFFIKIINDFNACKTFNDQMDFLKENNEYLIICLDNDNQYVMFNEKLYNIHEENIEYAFDKTLDFNSIKLNNWFGNEEGVFKLFEYIGIKVENV